MGWFGSRRPTRLRWMARTSFLGDDGVFQLRSHTLQANALLLSHPLYGHARHHGHYVLHVILRHRLLFLSVAALPAGIQLSQLLLQLCLTVTVAGGQLEVLALDGFLLLFLDEGYLLLLLRNLGRYLRSRKMYARAHLVHRVDGLVGEEPVADISVCQFDTGLDGLVGIDHVVVVLVAVLHVAQYLQRLFLSGWLHEHFLEAALQGTVFLNGVAIFVERGGTDALDGTTCQSGLHDVGGIHRARRRACSDERMDLVDKDDDVIVLLQLLE